MSFEVKITAVSLGELADKVLALGAQLSAQTVPWQSGSPVMPEVKESMSRAKKLAEKAMEKAAAEVEQPALYGGPIGVEGPALYGGPIGVEGPAGLQGPDGVTPEPEPVAEEPTTPTTFDFDKDVAPRVLAVVGKKGKATMQEILGEFGVERASQIAADVMAEFIEVLDKELAE